MKKNYILLHGTLSPGQRAHDYFWMPWLRNELIAKGHNVWMPDLPDGEYPDLERWLKFVLDRCPFELDENTIIVSHSAGGPLVLALLEHLGRPVGKVIMVAGFWRSLPDGVAQAMLMPTYNWEAIKAHCRKFFIISSNNDPWGCNSEQGQEMLERLGGTLIIPHNEGHMGSITYNQPYPEFPLVLHLAIL